MLDQKHWSPKRIQQRAETWPGATHYFVAWRGCDWKSSKYDELKTAKKQTQYLRRFHLIGESMEQLALCDFLTAWKWISDRGDGPLDLAATGRETTLAMLATLLLGSSQLDAEQPEQLYLDQVPRSVEQSACLPGLCQIVAPKQLLSLAQQTSKVVPLSFDSAPNRDWVDPELAPQQASGMKVVEVSATGARVWVRATQFALPNLGDLPEVEFKHPKGKQSWGAILPERGVNGLRFAVPGVQAEVRVGHRGPGQAWKFSPWAKVDASTDFSTLVELNALAAGVRHDLQTQVRGTETRETNTLRGSFRTLPDETKAAEGFRLAIGTCQSFIDRDGPHGFDMYRTMLARNTDAFVLAGDVVYYDRLARSKELAYYHWQRTYSLPTLVDFHKHVPSYFLKDDHDTYVNDSWPGQSHDWTDDFAFVDGQQIFMQQTGLPTPAYRTFQIGRDLQVWLMEGRDFRTANTMPDGPEKTIWGTQQRSWLQETLKDSTATFKVVISPTPIVGPDRKNKRDNHANANFATEGNAVRAMLAEHENTVVVCGDRHWQFHSVDPKTGLHEFSVGPTSDRHAGGWKQNDYRPEIHQYLRVGGGYVEAELQTEGEQRKLVLKHLDTHGKEHHRHVLTSNSGGDAVKSEEVSTAR
ncbi:MAG: alkaline phosphatase D family protein [Planctomycetota bacterium]